MIRLQTLQGLDFPAVNDIAYRGDLNPLFKHITAIIKFSIYVTYHSSQSQSHTTPYVLEKSKKRTPLLNQPCE